MADGQQGVQAALTAIDSRFDAAVDQLELWSLARQIAATQCLGAAKDILNIAYPPIQRPCAAPVQHDPAWQASREPAPPAIERWVSGYTPPPQVHRSSGRYLQHGLCTSAMILCSFEHGICTELAPATVLSILRLCIVEHYAYSPRAYATSSTWRPSWP